MRRGSKREQAQPPPTPEAQAPDAAAEAPPATLAGDTGHTQAAPPPGQDRSRPAAPPAPALVDQLLALRAMAAEGRTEAARLELAKLARRVSARTLRPRIRFLLVQAALGCGDVAYVSSFLTAETEADPPITIAIQADTGRPPPRSLIQCVFCASEGLRFNIPPVADGAVGSDQLTLRFLRTLPLFIACWKANPALQGTTILDVADAGRLSDLGYCANKPHIGLIPDTDFMESRGYAKTRAFLAEHRTPWAERKKVAFWRGATTGRGDGTHPKWKTLERVKLCQMVQEGDHAALFDVGISRLQFLPGDPGHEEVPRLGLMRPYVNMLEFQKFRYQIDIDGYTSAWSALFQKLLTGSTVLKIESSQGWRQWYYDRLKPWENYVPVASDMSDLVEKTQWLIDHDEQAGQIGHAGRLLAESLTYEAELRAGAAVIAGKVHQNR